MDAEERYLFDVRGYLVLRNVLTPVQVAAANAGLDAHLVDGLLGEVKPRRGTAGGGDLLSEGSAALVAEEGEIEIGDSERTSMLSWPSPHGDVFREVLVQPRALGAMREVLGDGFRLDHMFGIYMTRGTEGHVMHAIQNAAAYYRVQQDPAAADTYGVLPWVIRCGMTVCSYLLTNQGAGAGGFACVPGSHKQNFPPPQGVVLATDPKGALVQIEASAGDMVMFSENLLHGALPWVAAHERRVAIYKYSPAAISFTAQYMPSGVTEEVLEGMTEQMRGLLVPPFAGSPGRPDHFKANKL